MNKPQYPNLLIIGAMKCGTTSLHNYLAQHPDLYMTENKEPQFFCKERGDETTRWYKSLFSVSNKYYGESSIDYTKCHIYSGVPERIKKFSPNAKLIYIVREPIDRIISEYQHLKWKRFINDKTDLNTFLKNSGSDLIETSMYFKQISVYLEHFDKSQILFLKFEDLKESPYKVLGEISSFLEICEFPKNMTFKRFNDSKRKVKLTPLMASLNKSLKLCFDNRIGGEIKNKLKKHRVTKRLFYVPAYKKEVLTEDLFLDIKNYLKEDLIKFREVSGIYY